MFLIAQSLGEYGAASTLVDAFTQLWQSARDWLGINYLWILIPLVLFLLLRRKR